MGVTLEKAAMAKRKRNSTKISQGFPRRLTAFLASERCRPFRRRFLRLILLSMVVTGFVLGFGWLEGYVRGVSQGRGVQLRVMLTNPPAWAHDELIEQICLSSGVRSDDFLLSEELAQVWTENLAQNPWVRQITRVRKGYDGCVQIDCQLRQPIASIKQGGQLYYVDTDGVVLDAMPIRYQLVQLEGLANSLPPPGESVTSSSLMAGLGVLTIIREVDEQLPKEDRLLHQLAVLDISNYEGRRHREQSHLTFLTREKGTEIRWGAAVGRERPYYEAPAKYKLASLYRTYKLYNSLDVFTFVDLRNIRKEKSDPLREG